MKGDASLVAVSVCIRGVELNPHLVSDTLGIVPSRLQRKGDIKITSTNKTVVAKIGLWNLDSGVESKDICEHIDKLATKIGGKADLIRSIEGVSEAYLDVFIAADADPDGGGTIYLNLDSECINNIFTIGLPASFEIAVIEK
jgi:hypothetical protein